MIEKDAGAENFHSMVREHFCYSQQKNNSNNI